MGADGADFLAVPVPEYIFLVEFEQVKSRRPVLQAETCAFAAFAQTGIQNLLALEELPFKLAFQRGSVDVCQNWSEYDFIFLENQLLGVIPAVIILFIPAELPFRKAFQSAIYSEILAHRKPGFFFNSLSGCIRKAQSQSVVARS